MKTFWDRDSKKAETTPPPPPVGEIARKIPKIPKTNESMSVKIQSMKQLKSKTETIRELYDDIQDAQKHGVKISALIQLMLERGYKIKAGEFSQILHRIRKERGEAKKINRVIDKAEVKITEKTEKPYMIQRTEPAIDKRAGAMKKIEAYNSLRIEATAAEKYHALGGDVNDLIGLSESDEFQAVMKLTDKIINKCL